MSARKRSCNNTGSPFALTVARHIYVLSNRRVLMSQIVGNVPSAQPSFVQQCGDQLPERVSCDLGIAQLFPTFPPVPLNVAWILDLTLQRGEDCIPRSWGDVAIIGV